MNNEMKDCTMVHTPKAQNGNRTGKSCMGRDDQLSGVFPSTWNEWLCLLDHCSVVVTMQYFNTKFGYK